MTLSRTRDGLKATSVSTGTQVINRRRFLSTTTAAVGTVGAASAAWPFIDQMNPDARIRATNDVIQVDLVKLQLAEYRVVRWRNFRIFVVRRTPGMLQAMQDESFVAQLYDPDSQRSRQPSYAKNWHRSIDPVYAVLVGVCTHIPCIPTYYEKASVISVAGGYQCPCCATRFDPAGRAYAGISRYNLAVPPYSFAGSSKILLGKNASDELFSLQSVELI
jgi:ubiquinol-cytochrome c reductase iron-sulfur subunit